MQTKICFLNIPIKPRTLVAAVLLPLAIRWSPAQDALNNRAIVKMVKSGLGEGLVISMVQNQPGEYSLDPQELAKLKDAGVSDKIMAAMVAKGPARSPRAERPDW